jgi:hypothetical protein
VRSAITLNVAAGGTDILRGEVVAAERVDRVGEVEQRRVAPLGGELDERRGA